MLVFSLVWYPLVFSEKGKVQCCGVSMLLFLNLLTCTWLPCEWQYKLELIWSVVKRQKCLNLYTMEGNAVYSSAFGVIVPQYAESSAFKWDRPNRAATAINKFQELSKCPVQLSFAAHCCVFKYQLFVLFYINLCQTVTPNKHGHKGKML